MLLEDDDDDHEFCEVCDKHDSDCECQMCFVCLGTGEVFCDYEDALIMCEYCDGTGRIEGDD